MQSNRRYLVLGVLLVATLGGRVCPAVEPYLDFVRGLQDRGYADVALEYLDQLDARKDLPARVRDVLDLERSNSYLALARSGSKQADAMGKAQTYMNKFAREHPQHPRAAGAAAFKAEATLQRGQELLAYAERERDPARRAETLAKARPPFDEASKSLETAMGMLAEALAKLPPGNAAKAERNELELVAIEVRFKAGLANYYLAQTYPDPASLERRQVLKKADKLFDDIYQDYRHSNHNGCLLAHLWQGRVRAEVGDYATAQDVFEEVLAGAPETLGADSELAPIYAQAATFQFHALNAAGKAAECESQAGQWLQSHRAWSRLAAYQGAILELAKAKLALAETSKGEAQKTLTQQALSMLADLAKGDSPYRDEALRLHRKLVKDSGPQNSGVEQFFVLGDTALAGRQLAEAETNYNQALKLATEAKNQKLIVESRHRLTRVRLAQAAGLYTSGKLEEAIEVAGSVAREDLDDPSSGRGAVLALSAAAAQYAAAEAGKKAEEFQRLKSSVDFVLKRWAGRPEADDARITLGQAQLLGGDKAAGMATLGQVDTRSRRYPSVLFILAQLEWRTYLEERKRDEASRSAERMNAARTAAVKYLNQALGLLEKSGAGDPLATAAQLAETQLLLAEVLIEGREFRQAASLLDPLVAKVKNLKPESIDTVTFRTFMGAVRAHLALDDANGAAETALALVEIAQDNPQFNDSLVTFARLMGRELDRAEAARAEAVSGDAKVFAEAAARSKGFKQLVAKMVQTLAKRQALSVPNLVHLGDLATAVGNSDLALAQYQRVLAEIQKDPEGAKKAGRAIVRVQSELIGLLRKQGKFEEAAKQCDELIAKNPRALEPRLVKGYILDDWAQQDPAKYDDAVAQLTEVRLMLGRVQPRPKEYYDIVYRTAFCLYQQWQKSKDSTKLQQAEQVLKSTLVLSPSLGGTDLLPKYKELLKKLADAKGK